MRRAASFVLVFGCGLAVGWVLTARPGAAGGRAGGYPAHVEIVRPTAGEPGATSPGRTHRLKVVSASEEGWPVAISDGAGGPTWKVKMDGARPLTLFCEEEPRR